MRVFCEIAVINNEADNAAAQLTRSNVLDQRCRFLQSHLSVLLLRESCPPPYPFQQRQLLINKMVVFKSQLLFPSSFRTCAISTVSFCPSVQSAKERNTDKKKARNESQESKGKKKKTKLREEEKEEEAALEEEDEEEEYAILIQTFQI